MLDEWMDEWMSEPLPFYFLSILLSCRVYYNKWRRGVTYKITNEWCGTTCYSTTTTYDDSSWRKQDDGYMWIVVRLVGLLNDSGTLLTKTRRVWWRFAFFFHHISFCPFDADQEFGALFFLLHTSSLRDDPAAGDLAVPTKKISYRAPNYGSVE